MFSAHPPSTHQSENVSSNFYGPQEFKEVITLPQVGGRGGVSFTASWPGGGAKCNFVTDATPGGSRRSSGDAKQQSHASVRPTAGYRFPGAVTVGSGHLASPLELSIVLWQWHSIVPRRVAQHAR